MTKEAQRRRRRNTAAEELYRKFHGKRGKTRDTGLAIADFDSHPELAQLGTLVSLIIGEYVRLVMNDSGVKEVERLEADDPDAWFQQISFGRNPPQVAAEPSGKQIYFVGGNQDISQVLTKFDGFDRSQELIELGPCLLIEYQTRKRFDKFQPVIYFHALGEESGGFAGDNGANPQLMYNRVRHQLSLVGGNYRIDPSGIID